jgi:hypothetical protein
MTSMVGGSQPPSNEMPCPYLLKFGSGSGGIGVGVGTGCAVVGSIGGKASVSDSWLKDCWHRGPDRAGAHRHNPLM